MNLMTNKCALASILTVFIVMTGCTSYGRGTNQVEVSDANENRSLSLLSEINQLEAENTQLKNQVEVLQYELDQLNRRAQTQQAELDRLYRAEGLPGYVYEDESDGGLLSGESSLDVPQPGIDEGYPAQTQEIEIGVAGQEQGEPGLAAPIEAENLPQSTSSLAPQEIYNTGFEQLKQGQYDESIQTFSELLASHPTSTFADDAQYWTGEAYYVNRKFPDALQAFNNVVNNYPGSDRAPDALLKTGYIYYEQGDAANARNVFNDILVKYPNERVADFARERLKNL